MDEPRPLLTRLRAENVRSFATLDLELGPLTVLVGPNGAGKSNVVELLRFIRDASAVGLAEALARQRGWSSFVRSAGKSFGIAISLDNGSDRIDYKAEITDPGTIVNLNDNINIEIKSIEELKLVDSDFVDDGITSYRFSTKIHQGLFLSLIQAGGIGPVSGGSNDRGETYEDASRLASKIMKFTDDARVYNPVSGILRDQVQRVDANPVLKEDVNNLGAVLLAIRETAFGGEVDRALALLVDGVTGYRILQAGSTLVPQILYGPDDARDLGLESDGTIRLVALLAALYQPVAPSLIVLEEPEMGLHPGVLGALSEIIEEASTRMQVLVTTHSPDLIDRFDPDVIRIVEKVNGESVIGRVDSAQRDLIHKRLYRPSELMRIEGLAREPR